MERNELEEIMHDLRIADRESERERALFIIQKNGIISINVQD
jgi:ABC-type metal ion transport system substrate-binding protein